MAPFSVSSFLGVLFRSSKASIVFYSGRDSLLYLVVPHRPITYRACMVIGLMVSFMSSLCSVGRTQPSLQTQTQRKSVWLTESWTAEETQWRRLRQDSEREIARSTNRGQLLQRLRSEAQKKLQDARVQYRWGYAVYRAAVDGSAPAERAVPSAALALATVPSPRAYEFARLRFLLESKQFPSPRLRGVGERLAKRDPKDYAVKYRLVKVLDPGLSAQQKQQALRHARDLVRLQPRRASAHASLASVYYRTWLVGKGQSDGNSAIAAYRKYLQLAPAKDSFRKQAQQIIKMIQQERAKQKTN